MHTHTPQTHTTHTTQHTCNTAQIRLSHDPNRIALDFTPIFRSSSRSTIAYNVSYINVHRITDPLNTHVDHSKAIVCAVYDMELAKLTGSVQGKGL